MILKFYDFYPIARMYIRVYIHNVTGGGDDDDEDFLALLGAYLDEPHDPNLGWRTCRSFGSRMTLASALFTSQRMA